MKNINKNTIKTAFVGFACKRIKTLKLATMLWNWIDDQKEPEKLWDIMKKVIPWAFFDKGDSNSMKFTY